MARSLRWLALAGGLAPLLFQVVLVIEENLQLRFLVSIGFDPLKSSFPSANALGPLGWMQTLNFILLGVLVIGFAYALHQGIRGGSAAGPICFSIVGACTIVAGLFPTDLPVSSPPHTFHGLVHALAFIIASLGTLVGYVLLGLRFRSDSFWRGYDFFSFATALVSVLAFVGANLVKGVVIAYAFAGMRVIWFAVVGLRLWSASAPIGAPRPGVF